jgi:hypothetical protein
MNHVPNHTKWMSIYNSEYFEAAPNSLPLSWWIQCRSHNICDSIYVHLKYITKIPFPHFTQKSFSLKYNNQKMSTENLVNSKFTLSLLQYIELIKVCVGVRFNLSDTSLAFTWRDWRQPRKTFARIVTVPAKIQTWHLRNTSQKQCPRVMSWMTKYEPSVVVHFIFYGLLSDVASSTDNIIWSDTNGELERMWKELSQHLLGIHSTLIIIGVLD